MSIVVLHQHDPTGTVAEALREAMTLFAESSTVETPEWPVRVISCVPDRFVSDQDRWLVSLGLLQLVEDAQALDQHAESALRAAFDARRGETAGAERMQVVLLPTFDERWDETVEAEVRAPLRKAAEVIVSSVAADVQTAQQWSSGLRVIRWVALRQFPTECPKSLVDSLVFTRPLVMVYSGVDLAAGPRDTSFFRQRLICDLLLLAGLIPNRSEFDAALPQTQAPALLVPWSVRVESRAHLVARDQLIGSLLGGAGHPGLLPQAQGAGSPSRRNDVEDSALQALQQRLEEASRAAEVASADFEWPTGQHRPEPRDLFSQLERMGPIGRDGNSDRSWPVLWHIRWPFHLPVRQMPQLAAQLQRGLDAAEPRIRRHILGALERTSRERREQIETATRDALRAPMAGVRQVPDRADALRTASPAFVSRCDEVIALLQGSDDAVTSPDQRAAATSAAPLTPGGEAALLAQRTAVPSSGAAWIEAAAVSATGLLCAGVFGWTGVGLIVGLVVAVVGPLVSLVVRNRQAKRYMDEWASAREDWKKQALQALRSRMSSWLAAEQARGQAPLRGIASAVRQAQRRWLIELRGLRAHLAASQAVTTARLSRARSHAAGFNGVWLFAGPHVARPSASRMADTLLRHFDQLTDLHGLPPAPRVAAYEAALAAEVHRVVNEAQGDPGEVDNAIGAAMKSVMDAANLSILSSAAPGSNGQIWVALAGERVEQRLRNLAGQHEGLKALPSDALPADVVVAASILVLEQFDLVPPRAAAPESVAVGAPDLNDTASSTTPEGLA